MECAWGLQKLATRCLHRALALLHLCLCFCVAMPEVSMPPSTALLHTVQLLAAITWRLQLVPGLRHHTQTSMMLYFVLTPLLNLTCLYLFTTLGSFRLKLARAKSATIPLLHCDLLTSTI